MAGGYSIELSFNNRAVWFELPVLPEEIEISGEGDGEKYNILDLGAINVIKAPGLKTVGWQSFFPSIDHGGTVPRYVSSTNWGQPADYIRYIEDWMNKRKPIRFIFTSKGLQINMAASIEEFNYKEVAGRPGDFEYELSLQEYVFYGAKKVVLKTTTTATGSTKTTTQKEPAKRADDRAKPRTVTVKSGDSLYKIAKQYLGSGERWKEIQKLNGLTDAQVKALKIGSVLKLPG
ncbi:LysM peptidoglycan-binding domain-containing protein [Paenibacillus sp. HN-1]|uniref:LysM peptidoglycan-binding domain-containing protein n=1 Tax=Paenibacillus TaxID=44249 RepID=UPI001CA85B66|nr:MULTISPECIES: LysM peptidoglycan-binding domain-containing protein [Paenibacillus]MBY9078311.1 LysM peptidoglycan-binding domain-containing protein [Paenibacillus sp. CGMCC 1.18879]MBY9086030.1 LysM peptidoglycan-binding domain-containing protein [Paenibacillus sinensis]